MTSKGKQQMKKFSTFKEAAQKIVIKKPWGVEVKDYKAGDPIPAGTEFKIFNAADVNKIEAYADGLDESATYQKKRFLEPAYMYESNEYVLREKMPNGDYYYIHKLQTSRNKRDNTIRPTLYKKNAKVFKNPEEAKKYLNDIVQLNPNFSNRFEIVSINESFETKKDYMKYIDQFEKDVKKYIDWMKRDVKENKEVPLPDAIINLATAITNAMNRYNNAVKTKTLNESFIIQDSDSNNKPVYFHYGKYTGYDWGFDKNAATKFSTKEAAERMLEKMRQEGMLINSMKVVSEGRIAKGYENLDAEEKAKHLLSHPSSKYMNDLKSENITERAIRKAVKEMLGKPAKDDPEFIADVNEEGEAPAIANTTAEVANPDLPLKLKEGENSWEMGNGDKIEVKSDVVIRTTKDGEKFMMSRKEWENGDSSNREPNWRKMKEATKVPYLLKNAKVGDTFHDGSDLGREYKITRVTPSKVYATCVKDSNVTGEYNRSHSDYNETDPQWAKLYTIKY